MAGALPEKVGTAFSAGKRSRYWLRACLIRQGNSTLTGKALARPRGLCRLAWDCGIARRGARDWLIAPHSSSLQRLVEAACTCDPRHMIDISDIAETVPLPAAPAGWFDYGYKALMDGTLALVRTRRDVHAEYRQWQDARAKGDPDIRRPVHGNASPPPDRHASIRRARRRWSVFSPISMRCPPP